MAALDKSAWQKSLAHALAKRQGLPSNAFRWCNGLGDGLEGLVVDVYGHHVQVSVYQPEWKALETELVQVICNLFPVEFLVVKDRLDPGGRALEQPEMRIHVGGSEHATTLVKEKDAVFQVNLLDTVNPGLFLDMRANRLRVRELCRPGSQLLNLFCYTGSFSVHARLQGAERAVNVDVSGKILDRVRENYALNGLDCRPGEFFKGDAREYLDWAGRKGLLWESIVLDPPSFSRGPHGVFQVEKDLGALVESCVKVLAPRGAMLVSSNCSGIPMDLLKRIVGESLLVHGRIMTYGEELSQDLDFPGSGKMRESHLAAFLFRLEN